MKSHEELSSPGHMPRAVWPPGAIGTEPVCTSTGTACWLRPIDFPVTWLPSPLQPPRPGTVQHSVFLCAAGSFTLLHKLSKWRLADGPLPAAPLGLRVQNSHLMCPHTQAPALPEARAIRWGPGEGSGGGWGDPWLVHSGSGDKGVPGSQRPHAPPPFFHRWPCGVPRG